MKKVLVISLSVLIATIAVIGLQSNQKVVSNHPVYAYKVNTIDGVEVSLDQYKGKVLLIVNVASKCGFTPQYADLQKLYEKYKDKGFEILAFPCNQFRGQEPGSNNQIKEFCTKEYGVTFPMFSKIEVNGPDADPLFKYLTASGEQPIRWNFEKFLINKNGVMIKRFGTKTPPMDIVADIERQLSAE